MGGPSLFEDELSPQAARLAPRLRALAARGIFFGTSSWKYEGWLGSIYSPDLYQTRGRFSKPRFERECLREYARIFPTVCGDFSFYQFPTAETWRKLFEETPASLQFAFKAPEEITVARWPSHARYGGRGGQLNPSFLDPALFARGFLEPLERYRHRVNAVILEFGAFARAEISGAADFASRLDRFLAETPPITRLAVEVRNREFLADPYFETLTRHSAAHVYNAWTRMPELDIQAHDPRTLTADFTVVRALLSHGRSYEQAVRQLQPYDRVKSPDPKTRAALAAIANHAHASHRSAFIYVNNRLEGNAPTTIEAVADSLEHHDPAHESP